MNPLLDNYQFSVNERIEFEKSASKLIKHVGDLFYERNVEIVLFRQPLLDQKSSEILQAHSHATVMASEPITIQDTLSIAKSISNSSITNATIDIGKLSLEWKREAGVFLERKNFINSKLIDFKNSNDKNPQPRDVILYGFGRIGRLTARELITQEGRGNQLRLRAIVIRGELNSVNLEKRASNLRVDSIHGHFPGTVEVDHERSKLIINGRPIHVISTNSGERINYENFGINDALLIDNTGVLRDKKNLSNIGDELRPGIVHRIDKDTSGLVVIAKNNFTHEMLSKQFSNHTIKRVYQALIWGKLRPQNGKIQTLITRSSKNRQLMEVGITKGKRAITNYKTLQVFEEKTIPTFSLVECQLETGRTHQIRVHMSYNGNHILGDKKYKKKFKKLKNINKIIQEKITKLDRQFLHAKTLGFVNPADSKQIEFSSKLPKDLENILKSLKNACK